MSSALDIGPLMVWIGALAVILSFGTSLWNILGSGTRQNATKLSGLEARVTATERLIQHHTDQIEQIPSIDMMHQIELSLARLHGDLGRLEERLKPLTAVVERMQELMIDQARK